MLRNTVLASLIVHSICAMENNTQSNMISMPKLTAEMTIKILGKLDNIVDRKANQWKQSLRFQNHENRIREAYKEAYFNFIKNLVGQDKHDAIEELKKEVLTEEEHDAGLQLILQDNGDDCFDLVQQVKREQLILEQVQVMRFNFWPLNKALQKFLKKYPWIDCLKGTERSSIN